MWRFVVLVVLPVPLLWTAVNEWRLVVDGPSPVGDASGSSAPSPEKCVPVTVNVEAARNGYRAWATMALRIDKSGFNYDSKDLENPWELLCDHTKARVESLRGARRFAESYRKGGQAEEGDPVEYRKAVEQRKIDVALLQRMWREGGKWKREKDDDELPVLGESKDDVNVVARKALRNWLELNRVLNKAAARQQIDLLSEALKNMKDNPKGKPFAPKSVERIDAQVKQLKKFKEMRDADLGGLHKTVEDAFGDWDDLKGLKDEVNSYNVLADKIHGVDAIVAQLKKIRRNKYPAEEDKKLANEAKEALKR